MCCLAKIWQDTDPALENLQLRAWTVHFNEVMPEGKGQTYPSRFPESEPKWKHFCCLEAVQHQYFLIHLWGENLAMAGVGVGGRVHAFFLLFLQKRVLQKKRTLQSGGIESDLSSVIVLKGIQTFPFAQEISKNALEPGGERQMLSTL